MKKIFLLLLIISNFSLNSQCISYFNTGVYNYIIKSDNSLWFWGVNSRTNNGFYNNQLTQFDTSKNWNEIYSARGFSIAKKKNGSLWAWGVNNQYGSQGTGSTNTSFYPTQIGNDTNWTKISVFANHVCGLKKNGSLWCWGRNESGQIGDGSFANKLVPIQIGQDSFWIDISVGESTSYALTSSGSIYGWGSNLSKAISNVDSSYITIPMQIESINSWKSICAGYASFHAINKDGSLWGKGQNLWGTIGDSSTTDRLEFKKIGNDTNWVKIISSVSSKYGLKKDSSLWSWGQNSNCALGDSTNLNKYYPSKIGHNNDWTSITGNSSLILAQKVNRSIWGWGNGAFLDGTNYNNCKNFPILLFIDSCFLTSQTFINFPTIKLNTSIAYSGDTLGISGINFPSNYSDSVSISNSKGETKFRLSYTTNSSGSFSISKTIGASELGIYSVVAFDTVQKRYTQVVRYEVKKPTTMDTSRVLQIYSPENIASIDIATNPKVNILWKDKISNSTAIINKTATSGKKYTIEYQKDGGSWTLATTQNILPAKGLMNTWANFNFQLSFAVIGNYKIRVKETDKPSNWDTTSILSVVNSKDTNVLVSFEWDRSGAVPTGYKPLVICADGTARVYLRVKKKSSYPYTISSVKATAIDPDNLTQSPIYLGKLLATNFSNSYDTSGNQAISTSSTNSTIDVADSAFWFWYVAPDNFFRSSPDYFKGERIIKISLEINYSNKAPETIQTFIRLFRPPVLLVHGLNSDEGAWDNFKFNSPSGELLFASEAQNMFKAGVKANTMLADALFIDNAYLLAGGTTGTIETSFQGMLLKQRNKGIACNRVDYICHSMGGCMIRSLINNFPNLYYATGNSLMKNYNRGFTNKIITINTPHNGSVWANLLKEQADKFTIIENSLLWDEYVLVNKLKSFFTPYDFNGFLGIPKFKATNAVINLQSWDPVKQDGGVAFSETKNVRAAFIASNMLISGSFASNVIENLLDNEDPMMKVLYKLLKKKFPLIHNTVTFVDKIDNKFTTLGAPNFFTTSDLVVQLPSQLAGGDFNNTKPNEFLFNGPNHLNVLNKLNVGNKCFELLNDNIFSDKFATSIPANPSPKVLRNRSADDKSIDSVVEYFNDTLKFKVTSIPDVYTIDTNLAFSIEIKDTTNLQKVNFVFQGELYNGKDSLGLNSYSIKVNANRIDTQVFLVSLKYDSLGYDVYRNFIKKIKIVPYNNPISLTCNPEIKQLNISEYYCPELLANHNTFISTVSLSNSDILINIADTNVVSLNKTLSKFYAKDIGSTYISFDYKGQKDTLYIAVVLSSVEDGTDCIPPVSDFAIMASKLSINTTNASQNTSTYKWSFGDNTFSSEENPSHTYTVNGDYTVCLTSYNPCDSHRVCKTISICDKPIVNFDIAVSTAEVSPTNTSTNATSYRWTFGDGQSDNTTSPKHTYTANGDYDVCLTAYNNCDSATLCKKAKIEGISSAISSTNTFGIIIYPNPTSSVLNIDFTKNNFSTLKIENLLGQIILTKNLTNLRNQINIANLPKGNYLIELSNNKGEKYNQKLTIE